MVTDLKSITDVIGDGLHGTPEYDDNGQFFFINGNNLNETIEIKSDTKRVNEEEYNKYKKPLNSNTILLSINGTLGNFARYNNEPVILGKSACYINIKQGYNVDYISWFLKSKVKSDFERNATGTTIKNISLKQIREFQINLPDDVVQEKIAKTLNSIQAKIDVNNKINRNLENQTQLLFNQLFTFKDSKYQYVTTPEFGDVRSDFDIQKIGDIPMLVTDFVANGSFASLKANVTLHQEPEFAYFIRNTDLKVGKFEVYVDKHSYEFLSKSEMHGGEIIISNVGDVGSVFLCPKLDKPMTLGNNIIMLRPENDVLRYFLYVWFKWSYGKGIIKGITGGSAQPKFNKTDFKNTPIIMPEMELLSMYNDVVAPMFKTIARNNDENYYLSQTRDTLLPKLMSGELDVTDLDI